MLNCKAVGVCCRLKGREGPRRARCRYNAVEIVVRRANAKLAFHLQAQNTPPGHILEFNDDVVHRMVVTGLLHRH
jgi:hypothetical protein